MNTVAAAGNYNMDAATTWILLLHSYLLRSYLFHVDFKGPSRLTFRTHPRSYLLILALLKGAQDKATFTAVILDHAELWKDTCRACHDSRRLNQLIQMQLSAM